MGGSQIVTKRERILATVDDLVSCFLYYDRKEDKGLDKFREELEKNI